MPDKRHEPSARSLRNAVLIDGDWLIAASRQLKLTIDYRSLAAQLRNAFGPVAHLRFFASFDEHNSHHNAFKSNIGAAGYAVHEVPITRAAGRTLSKGLDVLLAVTAAALLPEIDQLVLLSGDSDFVPLLTEAQRAHKTVVLLSLPYASSRQLVDAATRVVSLESFITGTSFSVTGQAATAHSARTEIAVPDELYVAKGEYIEPYILVRRLFKSATRDLVVVDPYIDEQVFEMVMLVTKTAKLVVVTDENKLKPPDYKMYIRKLRREGWQIELLHSKDVHDRFIKIDNEWWHSGHTIKDLGTKDSVIKKLTTAAARAKAEMRLQEYILGARNLCP